MRLKIVEKLVWFFGPIQPDDALLWKTNDCEPYEWTKESVARFNTLLDFWKRHGPFRIILSGGLANAKDKTIALAIKERIADQLPEALGYILSEADHDSNDTAAEVRNVAPIFSRYRVTSTGNPRLWVLSNYWHTRRLWLMFLYKGIWARLVVSPTSGNRLWRFKRFLNEIALLVVSAFDPNYKLVIFARERERRTKLARSRDLSQS